MKHLFAIAVALSAIVAACTLKAPLGEPAASRVDHRLDGVWLAETGTPKKYAAALVAPFDDHSYVVVFTEYKNDNGRVATEKASGVCKGWLTEIAGDPFLTIQPVAHLVPTSTVEKSYFVGKLIFDRNGGLQVQFLNEHYKNLESITDSAALERVVTASLQDADLFQSAQSYRRCREDDPFEKKLQEHLLDGWK